MSWRISVVVDNWVAERSFRGEHGLSLLIEKDDRSFLFDTGQSGEIFLHNAAVSGLRLENLKAVLLSHGHYDHTGGLPALTGGSRRISVYAHPDVFQKKYDAGDTEELRFIGLPWEREELEQKGAEFFCSPKPVEPAPGLMLTGEIPFTTGFEERPRNFVSEKGRRLVEDLLLDEQALLVAGSQGLVVILGCGHRGVVNTLRYAVKLTGEKIQAVIGGLHLAQSRPEVVNATVDYLRETGAAVVAPLHCTGPEAVFACRRLLGKYFYPAGAGTVFEFA